MDDVDDADDADGRSNSNDFGGSHLGGPTWPLPRSNMKVDVARECENFDLQKIRVESRTLDLHSLEWKDDQVGPLFLTLMSLAFSLLNPEIGGHQLLEI